MEHHKIENVIEYIKVLDKLHRFSKTMIYRGQANSNWNITSSAYRELSSNENDPVPPTILKEYHH